MCGTIAQRYRNLARPISIERYRQSEIFLQSVRTVLRKIYGGNDIFFALFIMNAASYLKCTRCLEDSQSLLWFHILLCIVQHERCLLLVMHPMLGGFTVTAGIACSSSYRPRTTPVNNHSKPRCDDSIFLRTRAIVDRQLHLISGRYHLDQWKVWFCVQDFHQIAFARGL